MSATPSQVQIQSEESEQKQSGQLLDELAGLTVKYASESAELDSVRAAATASESASESAMPAEADTPSGGDEGSSEESEQGSGAY